jgi:hypothetical protein
MSDVDDVFARERSASRRRLWQMPLYLLAVTLAFLLLTDTLTAVQAFGRGLSGNVGVVVTMAAFLLSMIVTVVMFFALPQAYLVITRGVRNPWARLVIGAISGWIYLFVNFVTAEFFAPAGVGPLALIADLPLQIAAFARTASPVDLILFAAIGAAFGLLIWRPMYGLGNRRHWNSPTLGGPPPYAR